MHSKLAPPDGGPKAALLVCTMKIKILRKAIMSLIVLHSIFLKAEVSAKIESTKKPSASKRLQQNSLTSYAVNMQDGGLILKEEGDSLMNVSRTYRSRSLDHGFFGQGWCTDLESKIIFQGQGVLRLVNCQSSRPAVFKINATASGYISEQNPNDQIVIKLGFYERRMQNEWIAKYNFKGQLIESKKDQKLTKLMYNSRGLPEKILRDQNLISFRWNPLLDLIEEVKWHEQTQKFEYSGFNLVKVSSPKSDKKMQSHLKDQTIYYTYDDLDNLIHRGSNTGLQNLEVVYDKSADRVLRINGLCHEVYTYTKPSTKRTLSTVSKSCEKISSKREFIFDYAENTFQPKQITVNEIAMTKLERIALNQSSNGEGSL